MTISAKYVYELLKTSNIFGEAIRTYPYSRPKTTRRGSDCYDISAPPYVGHLKVCHHIVCERVESVAILTYSEPAGSTWNRVHSRALVAPSWGGKHNFSATVAISRAISRG